MISFLLLGFVFNELLLFNWGVNLVVWREKRKILVCFFLVLNVVS